MTEAEYIAKVNQIAERYNCRTVQINPHTKIINIEGPEDAQVQCAIALEDELSEYVTKEPESLPNILLGWPV